MTASVRSKIFQSGNSVAVRLPKSFGFTADTEIEIEKRGRDVVIRTVVDPDEERRLLKAAMDELAALPAPREIETREPIYFPDRPGLYD